MVLKTKTGVNNFDAEVSDELENLQWGKNFKF